MKHVQINQWSKFLPKKYKTLVLVFNPIYKQHVISNPNTNNTETTETLPSNKITEISLPASSTLILGSKIRLQLPANIFEAILIFIVIQKHLKCLHFKIVVLLQNLINFGSKTLQHYHFHNSKELIGLYQSITHLLILLFEIKLIHM